MGYHTSASHFFLFYLVMASFSITCNVLFRWAGCAADLLRKRPIGAGILMGAFRAASKSAYM